MRSTSAYRSGCTAEASRGFSAPRIRRKPAACSKPFAPSPRTFMSSLRDLNGPCSLRYATMFAAVAALSPETYESSCLLAVLTSTPTLLTQLTTTSSSDLLSCVWLTSCWYWPTPIDWGSIFTSSASGSMSLRPIETAPRTVMSLSGNSSRATSLAEYIDAPLSFTITIGRLAGSPRDLAKASVSRPAVPLPMAIASISKRAQRPRILSAASFLRIADCSG